MRVNFHLNDLWNISHTIHVIQNKLLIHIHVKHNVLLGCATRDNNYQIDYLFTTFLNP